MSKQTDKDIDILETVSEEILLDEAVNAKKSKQ
jgi:hypothetical protein